MATKQARKITVAGTRYPSSQGPSGRTLWRMEITMKLQRISIAFFVILLAVSPASGVSKEIVQLQTQVQQLQDQMTSMKQSFDQQMGVMQHLIEQSTDNVNKVANSINQLQQAIDKQQNDSGARVEQVSGQIQAL